MHNIVNLAGSLSPRAIHHKCVKHRANLLATECNMKQNANGNRRTKHDPNETTKPLCKSQI